MYHSRGDPLRVVGRDVLNVFRYVVPGHAARVIGIDVASDVPGVADAVLVDYVEGEIRCVAGSV